MSWVKRWDRMQTAYLPEREERFSAMLDALERLLPGDVRVLDLACGIGSISQRLLERFPAARCIALDADPVLLSVGEGAFGNHDGQLTWVDADLTDPNWTDQVGVPTVDAVLSSTALHWLPGDVLTRVYHQLGRLIRPNGLFINSDRMPHAATEPSLRKLADDHHEALWNRPFAEGGAEDWDQWLAAVRTGIGLESQFAERSRRFGWRSEWRAPSFALHVGALREAGFRETGVIWQRMDDRILLAVR
jgi:trans-aconitate methyltransferase